jgi:hypothetical protein
MIQGPPVFKDDLYLQGSGRRLLKTAAETERGALESSRALRCGERAFWYTHIEMLSQLLRYRNDCVKYGPRRAMDLASRDGARIGISTDM